MQNAWLAGWAVDQTKVSAPYPFLARIVYAPLPRRDEVGPRPPGRPTSALGCPIHSSRNQEDGLDKMTYADADDGRWERLSPLERAAFLLHDVFGVPLGEGGRHADRERGGRAPTRRPARAERGGCASALPR